MKKFIILLILTLMILVSGLNANIRANLTTEQKSKAILVNKGSNTAYQLLELESGSYYEFPVNSDNWYVMKSNTPSATQSQKQEQSFNSATVSNNYRDPEPLTAVLNSLNSQNFPFIYANVAVNSYGEGITNLDVSNFTIYENGVLQNDFVEITPPESGAGQRLADIIFCLDVSGSMSGTITSVKNNMISFIQGMQGSGVDYRIGFITFADNYYVYNNHNLYSDNSEIMNIVNNLSLGEHGLGSGDDTPENQIGSMAESALFNFRPGAQKVVIMLTDAPSHEADWATTWTVNSLINERMLPNSITVYPVFYTEDYLSQQQYIPIAQATNPAGTYFDIYSNFNSIIDEIGNLVANSYVIRYRSSNPTYDGVLRNVEYQVSYLGNQAVANGSYQPGAAPQIERTAETLGWHTQSWPENTPITISCLVTDLFEPFTTEVRLHYKNSGTGTYTNLAMTRQSETTRWQVSINPAQILAPGLDYYISATDGQTTSTNPSVDPSTNPYQITILPNEAPILIHTPVTQAIQHTSVYISVFASDNTNFLTEVKLFYRSYGQLSYVSQNMNLTRNGIYDATIPLEVIGINGADYFIRATDDFGISSYSGRADNPNQIQAILDGTLIPGGEITQDHWTFPGSPYYVDEDIFVGSGLALLIDNGVEVRFAPNVGISVYGTLQANGVNFTARAPELGWDGIYLESATNQIQFNNCQIQHANRALTMQNTHGSFSNITISKEFPFTDEVAVVVNGASSPVFTNMFIDNYARGIVYNNENLRITSSPTLTNVRIRNTNSAIRPESRGLEVIGAVGLAINGARIENYVDGIYWDGQGTSDYRSIPTLNNIHISHDGINEPGGRTGISLMDLSSVLAQNDSIGGFNIGVQIQNTLVNRTTTNATLSGIQIRNTNSITAPTSYGLRMNGNIAATITNLETDDYQSGFYFLAENDDIRTTASATLTNVRIRNTSSTLRNDTYGIKLLGGIYANFNDVEIAEYDFGMIYIGDGQPFDRTTPTLTNVRIRNTSSTLRNASSGLTLIDLSSVIVDNDSIGGYPTGLEIQNDIVNRTTTSATLTNVRIRNTSSTLRTDTFGAKLSGNIAATVNNLEIDDYNSGFFFMADSTDVRTTASATLTNVRIRNTSSSIRTGSYGVKLVGGIYANVDDLEIEEYDYGLYYQGNGQAFDRTTPTLTNVRIRNTNSTLRNADYGIKLIDLAAVIVESDTIDGYGTGFSLETTNQTRTTASATLTNVRIRNTSSTLRTETTAASLKGNINASINGLDIEDYSTGLYYEGDGQAFDRTTPTLTNVRIRNTSSTLREPVQGIVLKNLAAVNLLKNIIYPNVTDLRGNAEGSGIILDNTHNANIQQSTVWGITNGINAINSNNVHFTSNVIWTNGAELANPIINTGSTLTVSDSDISYDNGVFPGASNLDKNPLFAGPKAGNFYLKIRSPLKDTGIGALPFDFAALAANRTYSMHRGWNLMGVPYTTLPGQNSPVAIFADDINPFYVAPNYTSIVQMNSNAMPDSLGHVSFNYSGSYNIPSVVRPAVGYWVNNPFTQDVVMDIYGLLDDGSYNLELPGSPLPNSGWYLVSNPYDRPIRFSDSTLMPSGAMLPWGYIYRRSTNSYVMVDANPANDNAFNTTDIPPWSAFFVKASSPADMLFINYPGDDRQAPAQDLVASSNFGSSQTPKPEWEFTLNAVTTGYADAVTFGISNASSEGYDPLDVPELPSAPVVLNRGLDFCIANNDWEINPGTYTRDIRSKETNSWSWPLLLNLEALLEDGRLAKDIRISPEFADKLPATHSFILQNPATGQSIDLKTQSLLLSVNIDTSNPAGGTTPWLIPLSLVVSPVDGGTAEELRDIVCTANYPNPFNPETTISYALGLDAAVSLEIYNVKGQLVNRLLNTNQTKGSHSVVWNGKDSQGHNVASGFYFYRLQAGETSLTRKILLMK